MPELILPKDSENVGILSGFTFEDGTFVLDFPEEGVVCRSDNDPTLKVPMTEISDPFSKRVALTEKIIELGIDPESNAAVLVAKSRGIKLK